MARISNCPVCGSQTMDALYCSQECAVAPLSDLLARIQEHLRDWKSMDNPEGQVLLDEVLEGRWAKLSDFLKRLEDRRFQEQQAESQARLDELIEYEVGQKAIREFREKRDKASRRAK